ncbi:hypothetical protein [Salipiger mucosus]|uniref:Uncharacterized protein n=1 Tax=Salipiger mucosus DSM 16094 TaxID=1123237 RepID=S9QR76_9RHOB|nr:hypothetical protein [Salipiger mucosus]EPX83916.1 hypothetical protein Salmuc_01691 [Salipiger mucosus DSM 16094]
MDSRPASHLGDILYYIAGTIFVLEQYARGNNLVATALAAVALCQAAMRSLSLHKTGGIYPRIDLVSCLVRVVCFTIATGLLAYVSKGAAFPMAASAVAFAVSAWIEWSRRPIELEWSAHPDWMRGKVANHGRLSYHVFQNVDDDWRVAVIVNGVKVDTLSAWNTKQDAMAEAQQDFDRRRSARSPSDSGSRQFTPSAQASVTSAAG